LSCFCYPKTARTQPNAESEFNHLSFISSLAATDFDEDVVRTELRGKLSHLKNCRVESIMKGNHTIAWDPRRVIRWVEIARQEYER